MVRRLGQGAGSAAEGRGLARPVLGSLSSAGRAPRPSRLLGGLALTFAGLSSLAKVRQCARQGIICCGNHVFVTMALLAHKSVHGCV